MCAALDARPGRGPARWIAFVGLWGGAVCLLAGTAFHLGPALDAPPAASAADTDGSGVTARQAAPQDNQSRRPVEEGSGGGAVAPTQEASLTAEAQPSGERFDPPFEGRLATEPATRGARTAALQRGPDGSPATRVGTGLPEALEYLAPAAFAVMGTVLVSVGAVFALLDWMGILVAVAARRHGMEAPEARHNLPSPEGHDRDSADAPDGPAGATAPAAGSGPPAADGIRNREPGQVRRPASAYGEEAGAAASGGVGPHGARAAGPGPGEVRRHASADSAGPTPVDAMAPAFGDAARPALGEQSPTRQDPTGEAAPPRGVGESPPLEPAGPGDLLDAWDEYRRNGDGHFSARGLQAVLDQWGLDVDVGHGDRVGAGGAVLVVESFGSPTFYVLPSFNKSPRAVADWFDDAGSGALTGRTQKVVRVGRGRWLESGSGRFEVIERGEVR